MDALANPMLGKSILTSSPAEAPAEEPPRAEREQQQAADGEKPQPASGHTNGSNKETSVASNNNNNNSHHHSPSAKVKTLACQPQEVRAQQLEHEAHEANSPPSNNNSLTREQSKTLAKDLELLAREAQESKIRTRKLQLEVEEKNEIINVLKDELETTKELSDRFQRENLQLVKDSKRVKFLQDENDFLQDKLANVEKFELEIKRLKEKLAELDFHKLRVAELEDDRNKAQEDSAQAEAKCKAAEAKLTRVKELEAELDKWKSFAQELEAERNSLQNKLLESIEEATKLNSINKTVEDEVKRLRSMVRSLEEQRDEEQASNSLIMNVADLKQADNLSSNQRQLQLNHTDANNPLISGSTQVPTLPDNSIKYELDKQIEKELGDENRNLKMKLDLKEDELGKLLATNQECRSETESYKKLISELRQDLACEKSLAQKLTKQLTSFTKQIQNLDRQYFPMHETSVSNSRAASSSVNLASSIPSPVPATSAKNVSNTNNDRALGAGVEKTALDPAVSKAQSFGLRIDKCEVNESSLLKSVTNSEYKRPEQKDAWPCDSDKKKANELQGNNSEDKGTDNETKQQVQNETSSKLSDVSKETDATISAKPDVNKDQGKKLSQSGKQSAESKKDTTRLNENGVSKNGLLGLAFNKTTLQLPLPATSTKTNKSSTLASGRLNLSKNEGRSSVEARHSSQASDRKISQRKSGNSTTDDRQPEVYDRLESAKKISPTALIDSEDELRVNGKQVYGKTSNNNSEGCINEVNNILHRASSSPSSSARSQSLSPSVAITVGHDSGFQSIGHDSNQISPPTASVDSARRMPSRLVSSVPQAVHPASGSANAKEQQQIISAQSNRSMPLTDQHQQKPAGADTHHSSTPACAAPELKVPATGREQQANPVSSLLTTDGSQKQKPTKERLSELVSQAANLNAKTNAKIFDLPPEKIRKDGDNNEALLSGQNDEDNNDEMVAGARRPPTPVKSRPSSGSAGTSFVRNSLPSRSVNFGHSKSSAYLDSIRAKVRTSSTTKNTSASFREQTSNLLITQLMPAQQQASQRIHEAPRQYVLNCMLDHRHSQRCYADTATVNLHNSQVVASEPLGPARVNQSPIQPSRQLSALIDPVSHERLMMSMLHQQLVAGGASNLVQPCATHAHLHAQGGRTELTEQQIAHLAMHKQHYYHQLQHMHQLHQMHHQHQHHLHLQHHFYHKYQEQQSQQAQQQQQQSPPQQQQPPVGPDEPNRVTQARHMAEPIYSGGSQFYTQPVNHVDQMYANMAANNSINQLNEQYQQGSRLVNGAKLTTGQSSPQQQQHHHYHHPNSQQVDKAGARTSPSRQNIRVSPHKMGQSHYTTLPQIDEVNGLPCVNTNQLTSSQQQRSVLTVRTPDVVNGHSKKLSKTSQPDTNGCSSNRSPSSSSSSPTSTASSNLSASSSASSSSSLNSLSTSSAPLNRSALRHTTTDTNRRQFSVERELVGALPMTATLSRVGSCRTNKLAGGVSPSGQHQLHTSVKCQQSPMDTPKILSTSQQQQQPSGQQAVQQSSQQQQLLNGLVRTRGPSVDRDARDKLVSNLANIRLNDGLAFASLRAPKRQSAITSADLNRSFVAPNSNTNGTAQGVRATSSSSSLERHRQSGTGSSGKSANANKSSVWFEYGCV